MKKEEIEKKFPGLKQDCLMEEAIASAELAQSFKQKKLEEKISEILTVYFDGGLGRGVSPEIVKCTKRITEVLSQSIDEAYEEGENQATPQYKKDMQYAYKKGFIDGSDITGSQAKEIEAIKVFEAVKEIKKEIKEKFGEISNRLLYFYGKIDGTYEFPNSAEGDLLKMIFDIINSI